MIISYFKRYYCLEYSLLLFVQEKKTDKNYIDVFFFIWHLKCDEFLGVLLFLVDEQASKCSTVQDIVSTIGRHYITSAFVCLLFCIVILHDFYRCNVFSTYLVPFIVFLYFKTVKFQNVTSLLLQWIKLISINNQFFDTITECKNISRDQKNKFPYKYM